ncbi:MAG: 30S ribosomal protein S17 [Phycisphaeraceae bacterium]
MSNDAQSTRNELTSARTGHVVSDKRDKTRTVEIQFLQKLPKYGKYVRQRSVFHVHDEQNASRIGDIVEIAPCRPLSKTKSWRLVRIVEEAPRETKAEAGAAAAAGGEG